MLEAQAGAELTKTESTIGNCKLVSFKKEDVKGLEMGLNVAMLPGGVVIGTLAGDVQSVVENLQKKSPALGATSAYQATAKHLSTAGAECEMFFRPDPLIGFALSGLRLAIEHEKDLQVIDIDGVERAVAALGLKDLGSVGATSSYQNGKAVSRAFHARTSTGTVAGGTKVIDTAFLKWVPKDAVNFSASTLDVASIYDTLVRALTAYDEAFAKQALEHLGAMEQQLGFKVRDDFFGAFGDHMISWSMPMGTITSAPEVAVLLKVTDEVKLVTVLKSLAKLTQGMVEIEEGEKRGLKAYQVRVNYDPTQGMGMNPFDAFTPTFAFKNGYLVAGFSASDVKRVFQRMDREDDPKGDIRGNKEFTAIAASLPAKVQSLSFTDWKAQFESYYQIATGLLAFVPMGEDVPIDMSLLPVSETLTKHLFGSISYSTTTEAGGESVAVGPFGAEMGLLLGGLVAGGAAAALGMRAARRF
jgi:hypothetical protein